MKKYVYLFLAVVLALGMAACSQPAGNDASTAPVSGSQPPATSPADTGGGGGAAPVAEEVKGVTAPAFAISVNGTNITQDEMAAYPMYSVQATSVNSAGTESTTTYVGFAIKDVLDAAGLTENYVWLQAVCDDGYSADFTGDVITQDTTLLAMTKDGSPFSGSPWFAPCTDQVTGNYLKGVVTILVNTTEGAPDIESTETPTATGEASPDASGDAAAGGLPEILDRTDKVEFEAFSFKVNGTEVNNDTLKDCSIYKIQASVTNSNNETSTEDYTGYKLADVLEAAGVLDFTGVTVVANDGYENELEAELANSEYTLLAIEKDKELGEDGTVWVAPCSESSSKMYSKLVVEIKSK